MWILLPTKLSANTLRSWGRGRLPVRRFPSKLCAILDLSRRLRMHDENRSISVTQRHAGRDRALRMLTGPCAADLSDADTAAQVASQ